MNFEWMRRADFVYRGGFVTEVHTTHAHSSACTGPQSTMECACPPTQTHPQSPHHPRICVHACFAQEFQIGQNHPLWSQMRAPSESTPPVPHCDAVRICKTLGFQGHPFCTSSMHRQLLCTTCSSILAAPIPHEASNVCRAGAEVALPC